MEISIENIKIAVLISFSSKKLNKKSLIEYPVIFPIISTCLMLKFEKSALFVIGFA